MKYLLILPFLYLKASLTFRMLQFLEDICSTESQLLSGKTRIKKKTPSFQMSLVEGWYRLPQELAKNLMLLANESVEMKMLTYLNRYESMLFWEWKEAYGLLYRHVYHSGKPGKRCREPWQIWQLLLKASFKIKITIFIKMWVRM